MYVIPKSLRAFTTTTATKRYISQTTGNSQRYFSQSLCNPTATTTTNNYSISKISQNNKCWLSQSSTNNDNNESVESSRIVEETKSIDNIMGIPSMEQLRTDPFMKQVRYAEFITGLIEEDAGRESSVLMNRLRAQLSHPDGIRGFMVTYLTTIDSDAGESAIPAALVKAILEQIDPIQDKNELISLMCMNVIMPTGMITMQATEEMAQQSASTAKRATQLLRSILTNCNNEEIKGAILTQCNAIIAVATTPETILDEESNENDKMKSYWRKFFQKWGYQSRQQADIADAVRSVLSA